MPRNGSGTMTVSNTFTANTTIASAAMNTNFTDFASEMTNSVAADGQTDMSGALKAFSGTAAAPGITFSGDVDVGFYRQAADTIGVSIGGTENAMLRMNGISSLVPTGAMFPYMGTSVPNSSAWVRANGRTIGNASSGATELASANTEGLFALLWDNFADSELAVSSGRGASAAADFAANKTIALPDLRGRGVFGLDDMGNSAASRLGSIISNETTNGSAGGTETHTLTEAQLPSHTHTMKNHTHSFSATSGAGSSHSHTLLMNTSGGNVIVETTGAHTHQPPYNSSQTYTAPGVANLQVSNGTVSGYGTATTSDGDHFHNISGSTEAEAAHTHSVSGTSGTPSDNTSDATGSGSAHSNMPPAYLLTWIIKL